MSAMRGPLVDCGSAAFTPSSAKLPAMGGQDKGTRMLEIRPSCECCDRDLPPASMDARICSFECTFCAACADDILKGTCPNCGGNLVARPIRQPAISARRPPLPSGSSRKTAASRRLLSPNVAPSGGRSEPPDDRVCGASGPPSSSLCERQRRKVVESCVTAFGEPERHSCRRSQATLRQLATPIN
jgi:hypothetical protein